MDEARRRRRLDRRVRPRRPHRRGGASVVREYPFSLPQVFSRLNFARVRAQQPGGAHGPAMALEDAVVFGTLLSNLSSISLVITSLLGEVSDAPSISRQASPVRLPSHHRPIVRVCRLSRDRRLDIVLTFNRIE